MFGFLPTLGVPELIIILVLALIFIGPGKLPELGRSFGRSIKEFRNAAREIKETVSDSKS